MINKELTVIKEGSAQFYIFLNDKEQIPSKSMEVFYNKKMEINRDITNLAINVYHKLYAKKNLTIVDCMAASGISSIRMLKECENIKKIYINDINPLAFELIHKNLQLNDISKNTDQIEVSRKDANLLFSEIAQNTCFISNPETNKPNVISIDPFGTPNIYIDTAFKAIQRVKGLMCITATDTAVLFGTRPKACLLKYIAKPLHTEYCKEIGARILICYISRIANINKLGIIPLLTLYSKHFIRIFALTFKEKDKINDFIKDYGFLFHCNNCGHRLTIQNNILDAIHDCPLCGNKKNIEYAGPIWINKLYDDIFVQELILLTQKSTYSNKKKISKLLGLIREENNMPISYYNIHKLCQILQKSYVPTIESIIHKIKMKGFMASRTHFDFTSIKTDMSINLIKNVLLELK